MGFKSLFSRNKKSTPSSPTVAASDAATPLVMRSLSFAALAVVRHARANHQVGLGFNKFDVNGDGKISPSELGAIIGSLVHPATEDELRSMILEVYADDNEFIDINEVVELNTKGINSVEAMQNLKDVFSVYDIDGNGSISAAELSAVPSYSP